MNLVRLIYSSKSETQAEIMNQELKSIFKIANTRNAERGISGMLLFSNQYFLQALEGSRSEVNEIFMKIVSDQRHSEVQIISCIDISKRRFDQWSMGWAVETASKKEIYFRYGLSKKFNPMDLNGDSAYLLLSDFADSANVVLEEKSE
jgi:hypothetical protein